MDARAPAGDAWRSPPPPPLHADDVHVWRIALDDASMAESCWPLLSEEERTRAARFFSDVHRRRHVVSHGTLRLILAAYAGAPPETLAFSTGPHGKPALEQDGEAGEARVEFNLSHSDDLALVAVARGRAVGIDVERWSEETEHLALAERFFSPCERDALRALDGETSRLTDGFFAAWTRKEAYLKATGEGITRGLHHFDVSLAPGDEARLLADRLDSAAAERWSMRALEAAEGFSAALVVDGPVRDVRLFQASPTWQDTVGRPPAAAAFAR